MAEHQLDNIFWHMLCHDFAEAATGTALAKRCDPEFLQIAAMKDHSAAACDDLATLFSPGEGASIFELNPPPEIQGFDIHDRFSPPQFVCQERTSVPEHDMEVLELTQADLQDMIELVDLTKPGPFFPQLLARRHFIGIRQDGQLVAMAGERMQTPDYCEISAVCTHPDWRAKGYARLLTIIIADGIWRRGQTPFLHVAPNNVSAIRIYESLHFVKRVDMTGYTIVRV